MRGARAAVLGFALKRYSTSIMQGRRSYLSPTESDEVIEDRIILDDVALALSVENVALESKEHLRLRVLGIQSEVLVIVQKAIRFQEQFAHVSILCDQTKQTRGGHHTEWQILLEHRIHNEDSLVFQELLL